MEKVKIAVTGNYKREESTVILVDSDTCSRRQYETACKKLALSAGDFLRLADSPNTIIVFDKYGREWAEIR